MYLPAAADEAHLFMFELLARIYNVLYINLDRMCQSLWNAHGGIFLLLRILSG